MPYKNKKILIIGSGPAALSLSATLNLASINHTILESKDKPGGILPEIENELDDFIVGTYNNGIDFVKKINEFVDSYNIKIRYNCTVNKIDISDKKVFFVQDNSTLFLNYDILVIASGSRFKIAEEFNISKLKRDIYYRISYCLDDFNNKTVAVIGGGDNATIAALRLTKHAYKVYLINKNSIWNSRKDLIDDIYKNPKLQVIKNNDLVELNGKNKLKSIEIIDGKSKENQIINIDKIVFKIGYIPNSEFLDSKIKLDHKGYIITKEKFKTNIKDVFAIGDIVSNSYKRISIALGHGTELGNIFLNEYL